MPRAKNDCGTCYKFLFSRKTCSSMKHEEVAWYFNATIPWFEIIKPTMPPVKTVQLWGLCWYCQVNEFIANRNWDELVPVWKSDLVSRRLLNLQNCISPFYKDHNAPCFAPKIFQNCCSQFLLGITVVPFKMLKGKQGALCSIWKWWMTEESSLSSHWKPRGSWGRVCTTFIK